MVDIILNLDTRSVPPKFHVVFDDMFTTVSSAHNEEVIDKIWTNMITNPNACLIVSLNEDNNTTLDEEWLAPEEVQEQEAARHQWIDQQHSFCWNNESC